MTLQHSPAPVPVSPMQVSPALATCDRMLRRSLRAASITILVSFGMVGGWLAVARLDSAVVAQAVLENANTTRQIQHLEGGIVREFFVRNGDRVKEGDLLLRLDSTQSAASAELFQGQILGNRARQERLEAELSMAPALVFSDAVRDQLAANPAVARLAEDEQRHFALQRKELEQAHDLLQTNIAQAEAEIHANEVRRGIASREIELVRSDLEDQRSLRKKGLTNQARVTELEQESLSLEEKIAQSDIDIARIRQGIAGLQLQIAQLEQEYRRRAAEQLETVTRETRALERDLTIANDSLTRVEIRAPVDGTVQESILGTVGAVIRSGETILKIAPSEDDYILAARVAPNDIDGILPGSEALITFPAFQSLDLSPAEGELITLSRDRIVDPYTRDDYYEARVRLDETTLPEAQRARLVAGMSATVILPTGERTALNYLVGPLMRRLQSAMREE
ncbi:HlyD family type I secretion periplasmic adaptor subunit [Gemmobacter lutimaris]|uniref:Membrane fusion protein (MFP) family protein n=1 Tax=Gemmobacter lutimaris TaxID=2306023 RepID=A0A398BIJ3_9RHOB|nr:HlyD family type I secretion periplasmic adaptor subunit [Gemmobacter lutimaris]RID90375.1 HlyD family type I secretion periplasmic adaptor subunit [Gemmobacter lutimaris]